jgi:hypothetical protein
VRMVGSVADILITKDMILSAKKAHAEYLLHLEKEKNEQRMKEAEKRKQETLANDRIEILERKKTIHKLIADQDTLEAAQVQEQDVAKQLIAEASSKLSVSLQHNDLKDAKVAQVMLCAGNTKLQETSQLLTKIREEKEKLQKKLAHVEQKEKAEVGLDPPPAKKMKRS